MPLPFVEEYVDENGVTFLKGSVKKSERLIELYAELAKEKDCHCLDCNLFMTTTLIQSCIKAFIEIIPFEPERVIFYFFILMLKID